MAGTKLVKPFPTMEQIRLVVRNMPATTDIELRDQALVAFTILTGIRDGATASLKLKHVNLALNLIEQRGDEVNTKFSKTIHTYFFPVGDEFKSIFVQWVAHLKEKLLFDLNDPLFPQTLMAHNEEGNYIPVGLRNSEWSSAGPIRAIFRQAFALSDLPYYGPHSFRNTLTRLAYDLQLGPKEMKAWSQNLGHESVSTTFTSYGRLEPFEQGNILEKLSLSNPKDTKSCDSSVDAKLDWIMKNLSRSKTEDGQHNSI
jgi:integrase